MNRPLLQFLVLSACAVLLSGCAVPLLKEPIGEKPPSADELSKMAGLWRANEAEDNTYRVTLVDAVTGEFLCENLNATEDEKPNRIFVKQTNSDGLLTDGIYYLSIENTKPQFTDYLWGFAQISVREDVILLWAPDPDALKTAISSGKLTGQAVESKDEYPFLLITDNAQLRALIEQDDLPYFMWKTPIILHRQPAESAPTKSAD